MVYGTIAWIKSLLTCGQMVKSVRLDGTYSYWTGHTYTEQGSSRLCLGLPYILHRHICTTQ